MSAHAAAAADLEWRLTARPWKPAAISREAYLDTVEGLCRYAAAHVNADGAFIDPYLEKEHQYATPYFAFAAGLLLREGRARDLLPAGVRAMEHGTSCLAGGHEAIPDGHGEFFIAPLSEAPDFYEDHVPTEVLARWHKRMQTPLLKIIAGRGKRINNWRTYAMKGEWLRARRLLADRNMTLEFIGDSWINRTQRERMIGDTWHFYQDWSSDPQSLAVEAVGRGNLLALVAAGYDGPHHDEIQEFTHAATETSLLFQDPTGQAPPNGRTDNHVFNDVLYLLCFETMAAVLAESDIRKAGVYRRAAHLAFESIQRWRIAEGGRAGSFQVTKNHFDPAERVGYQPASQYSNYNGAVMYHLAEAYLAAGAEIAERPAPAEQGGYTIVADAAFGSAVANAGGMQLFANLRGDVIPKYNTYWTPLGVARFSRAGWESRLGPIDGVYDSRERAGVTFAPEWKEGPKWRRLSEHAEHYRGTFVEDFAHPLLVRCHILYHTVTGMGGPVFRHDFIITPHLILATLTSLDGAECGVTLPVLVDDGRELVVQQEGALIRTAYEEGGDEQVFFSPDAEAVLEKGGGALQSSGGWLAPWRMTASGGSVHTVIYPRTPDQPSAAALAESFAVTEAGFTSELVSVSGNRVHTPFAAGGRGRSIDLNGDGDADVVFAKTCGFLIHHENGRVTAVETDTATEATMRGTAFTLETHTPVKPG
jgi:hypothetical protein